MKKIWIITLFPEYYEAFLNCGVLGKALRGERSLKDFSLKLEVLNLRDFSSNNYKGVDDAPFGGGGGMILRADILKEALVQGICPAYHCNINDLKNYVHIIYPNPRGRTWSTEHARDLGNRIYHNDKDMVFIAGRYEGIDERFIENYIDEHISLGDYILTGGDLAIMTIIDSAMRFVPGVLGNKISAENESFTDGLLEYPQYTRPREFEGKTIPEALLSGSHQKIQAFKEEAAKILTKKYRPDLWEKYGK